MCNHNSPRFSRGHDIHVMPLALDSGFWNNTCAQHNVSCYRTRSLHTNFSLSQRVSTCHQQSTSTWRWWTHVSASLHLEVASSRPRFFEVFLAPSWRLTVHNFSISQQSPKQTGSSRLTIRDRKGKGLKRLFFVSGDTFYDVINITLTLFTPLWW
jgi:hypothetical protein